jgi:hypothetical protein
MREKMKKFICSRCDKKKPEIQCYCQKCVDEMKGYHMVGWLVDRAIEIDSKLPKK